MNHTYATAGTYVVWCTSFDSIAGCTDDYSDTVTIAMSGSCDATFTSTNSGNGIFVFTNPGTYGSYVWDFGNGTTGYGQTATNVYNANGAYNRLFDCLRFNFSMYGHVL